jgi:HK97 family phage portal protein
MRIWPFGKKEKALSQVPYATNGGWFPLILESFSGAWQKNVTANATSILGFFAVFACVTLISSDISKMRMILQRKKGSIWEERDSLGKYAVLATPNHFQNRIQFIENWLNSKLCTGNTYILKRRDREGKITAMYVLDPRRVLPLVSDSGDVFYQLMSDNIAGLETSVTVPASEIIHDRFNCLFHPLVGLSPIFACALAASQGLAIQKNSQSFFANMSRPGGVLTAPGAISDEVAARMKDAWEQKYTGDNMGKVAVLGDGLKYENMSVAAEQAQLVEQLKMSGEIVCATFHVPPYKVGGQMPNYDNAELLEQQYYSQCLQVLIESIELLLKDGLSMPENMKAEFDINSLLRMDQATLIKTLGEGVGRAIFAPNEARQKLNMAPKKGGDSPMIQEQNYSLEALAARDAAGPPERKPKPNQDLLALPAPQAQQRARSFMDSFEKELNNGR